MHQMRSGTVAKLEQFWNALIAAAHGPLCKVDYPFSLASRCGINEPLARGLLKYLHDAEYIMPIHDDAPGRKLIGVRLQKTQFLATDFFKPKTAKERKQKSAIVAPASVPAVIKTYRQRAVLFLDLDNLCIELQKRGMVLGVSEIIQEAAEEGMVLACFGFIQRSTLERNRDAINWFPPELDMVVAPDYAQASDQKMLRMIKRFADNNIADVFFIGTADTELFETAQSAVKRVGKRAALLDCCKLSFGIRSEADRIVRIQNAAVPLNKQRLLQCAKRIAETKHLGRSRESQFLRNVVRQLRLVLSGDFNKRGEEFRELQSRVWYWLRKHGEALDWHPQDCRYALEALQTLNILVAHRGVDERTYYRINREAETQGVF